MIPIVILLIILSGCGAIIYAVRGPKYEGKFQQKHYLPILEDQYFYIYDDRSENYDTIRINGNDTTFITLNYPKYYYKFLRYDKDGKIRIKGIGQDTPLKNIPSKSEIDQLPVVKERFYVIKDSLIKYEVYHDSYNGYNLYKTRVYADSLVDWQIGISRMYLKTYKRLKK
jgi:hypothetical protein